MLSKELLNGCFQQERCGYHTAQHKPLSRLKNFCRKKLWQNQKPSWWKWALSTISIKVALKRTHSYKVKNYVTEKPSKLMVSQTPEIASKEKSLSSSSRLTPAQLRCGFWKAMSRFPIKNNCPNDASPYDIQHLFNCPSIPKSLKFDDQWDNPAAVAK